MASSGRILTLLFLVDFKGLLEFYVSSGNFFNRDAKAQLGSCVNLFIKLQIYNKLKLMMCAANIWKYCTTFYFHLVQSIVLKVPIK